MKSIEWDGRERGRWRNWANAIHWPTIAALEWAKLGREYGVGEGKVEGFRKLGLAVPIPRIMRQKVRQRTTIFPAQMSHWMLLGWERRGIAKVAHSLQGTGLFVALRGGKEGNRQFAPGLEGGSANGLLGKAASGGREKLAL